jgi:hypothetical protein|tara:strand:+ start:563 stop:1066 length:504 start_codon:yes stop_codon:yes gene_type:complete
MTLPNKIQHPRNKKDRSYPKNKNYKNKNKIGEIIIKGPVSIRDLPVTTVLVKTVVTTPVKKRSRKITCPSIKEDRKKKRFDKRVEKLNLKIGSLNYIGIGDDLYQCQVAMIHNFKVCLKLEGRSYPTIQDYDQYSLKTFKIMIDQGQYLIQKKERRSQMKTKTRIRL